MSEIKCTHSCSDCSRLGCRSASEDQYPPFCLTTNVDRELLDETLEIYRNDELQGRIARTSACIEGEFYGRLTRVEETIEFIRRMGFKKIGIASCVGLMRETSIFARILKASGIDYFTVGCKVGAGAVIGPNTILEKAEIGAGTTVNNSQVYESTVGSNTTVGPFAYIRPQSVVGDGCRIGDFVELKKSTIGNGTKVSHLTYIGDATVGERVNFGCGTVVVNYDGYHKYRTEIGDDCFIGCNTNLVSPVKLGDRAFTAAGTTVTKDVPAGALSVARSRQTNLEGWNDRRRAAHEKDEK